MKCFSKEVLEITLEIRKTKFYSNCQCPIINNSKHGELCEALWKIALIPYILEVVQCTGVIESDGLNSMGALLSTAF